METESPQAPNDYEGAQEGKNVEKLIVGQIVYNFFGFKELVSINNMSFSNLQTEVSGAFTSENVACQVIKHDSNDVNYMYVCTNHCFVGHHQ